LRPNHLSNHQLKQDIRNIPRTPEIIAPKPKAIATEALLPSSRLPGSCSPVYCSGRLCTKSRTCTRSRLWDNDKPDPS